MKRRILPLILIALLAAAIGRWTAPSAGEPADLTAAPATPAMPEKVAPAATPKPTEAKLPESPAPTPSTTAFVPPERPAPEARGLGFDPTNFLAGLPQQLDQIADLARGGDAKALGDLAEWIEYCRRSDYAVRMGSVPANVSNALVDGFKDASIRQYFKQIQSTCLAWKSRHPWIAAEQASMDAANRLTYAQMKASASASDPFPKPPPGHPQSFRRRAAEAGDLLSRGQSPVEPPCARPSPTTDQRQQIVQSRAYHLCIYQSRLEVLQRLLATRDLRVIASAPAILSMQQGGFHRAPLIGDYTFNEALWQLAACGLGLDCSASGPYLRNACAGGSCGYRSTRDYLADQRLTPAMLRRVEATVPVLIDAIQTSNYEAILGPPPP